MPGLEAGKGIQNNVDLCRFRPVGQRKEVGSLQAQARAVNTALNSLVIGIGITGTRNKFFNIVHINLVVETKDEKFHNRIMSYESTKGKQLAWQLKHQTCSFVSTIVSTNGFGETWP